MGSQGDKDLGMFQITLKYNQNLYSKISSIILLLLHKEILLSSGMTGAYEDVTTENLRCQC